MLLLALSILAACSGKDQNLNDNPIELKPDFQTNVIYGEDNRKDWFEVLDPDLREAARATLGIFDSSSVLFVDDSAVIETRSARLCPTEKFFEQEMGPLCSGFLVGPDLVLTAGHCIETDSECRGLKFVFDYAKESRFHDATRVSKNNVYSCLKMIGRSFTKHDQDWALIKLDRAVTDRSPLEIERSSAPRVSTPLTIIGHPSGLPSKISRGGQIHTVSKHHFVADLDSFGGNSGSAILNANTLKVEGILVRGRSDYKSVNGCLEVNVCEDGIGTKCKFPSGPIEGEHVSQTILLRDLIPQLESPIPEPEPKDPVDEDRLISKIMMPIPDSSLEKINSTITNVPDLDGSEINIRLVVEHAYISDLRITLIAPNGKKIILHKNSGTRVKNINGVYGLDLEPFDQFTKLGEQPSGRWTLELTDQAPFDKGYLVEWEIIPGR